MEIPLPDPGGERLPEMSVPRDVLVDECAVCGFALYPQEIAGELINGIYVDYLDRRTGQASMVFCAECWREIRTHNEEDIEIAIDRRIRSEGDGR
jgi:hypothetical protein